MIPELDGRKLKMFYLLGALLALVGCSAPGESVVDRGLLESTAIHQPIDDGNALGSDYSSWISPFQEFTLDGGVGLIPIDGLEPTSLDVTRARVRDMYLGSKDSTELSPEVIGDWLPIVKNTLAMTIELADANEYKRCSGGFVSLDGRKGIVTANHCTQGNMSLITFSNPAYHIYRNNGELPSSLPPEISLHISEYDPVLLWEDVVFFPLSDEVIQMYAEVYEYHPDFEELSSDGNYTDRLQTVSYPLATTLVDKYGHQFPLPLLNIAFSTGEENDKGLVALYTNFQGGVGSSGSIYVNSAGGVVLVHAQGDSDHDKQFVLASTVEVP
ncbi:hypothetical protein KC717_01030 [Candidatus Dojkabacteria bacterium]|uniref:Serine protease n=1 Tax=Candidatus Dojkabacteria bacterium TaxID=2099670 RepID=A0A955RK95_9BACT|nr:hypothetical protein [Candidatus Dojkabacteria bacterium]